MHWKKPAPPPAASPHWSRPRSCRNPPSTIAPLQRAPFVPKPLHSGAQAADGMPRRSIRFEQVTFTYPGRSEPVLDGFDLEIEARPPLASRGEKGAGRTQL